ncbi:MAG: small multi-drug export protein [Patescibacteria group bacterium]
MFQSIIQFFSQFPPEIATVLMAMTPVGELRLSLPVAVLGYHLPVWEAYLLAVFGNAIPAFIIAAFAGKFHAWVVHRAGRWGKDWADYLASVQKKFTGPYEKYGLWGLAIFIGVPLPMTGAWSGAVAAFIFGIPFKKSWPYILLGIAISGLLTLLLTVGADKIFWP